MDYTQPFGSVYWPNPNETYFSLAIRYNSPATVTVHEEYIVIDFYGMFGIVGGTLGLFVGFSFFDVLTYLITFFSKST